MTAHTSGPWRLHEYQDGETLDVVSEGEKWQSWTFAVGAGDAVVAEVCAWTTVGGYPRPSTRDEAEANARLIAAAPELLEALKEGRRAIGEHFAPNDCYATGPATGDAFRDLVQCPACSFIAMYDSAIAKATGGAA